MDSAAGADPGRLRLDGLLPHDREGGEGLHGRHRLNAVDIDVARQVQTKKICSAISSAVIGCTPS
jgi:hypothetical protein